MLRYIIEDARHVLPFNEPASLLTIGTTVLKVHQDEVLRQRFRVVPDLGATFTAATQLPAVQGEALVYRDNLFFDSEYLNAFLDAALKTGRACRAAFPADDPMFKAYALPLANGFETGFAPDTRRPIYMVDLWYFPRGYTTDIVPIVISSDCEEMGFYSVPDFMTMEQGDLTHYAPARALLSIESWIHVYFASILVGCFGRASRYVRKVRAHNFYALKVLWQALVEQRQILSSSEVVRVGKNTDIHPTAVITGPAVIGDNCSIGPGVLIDNCTIGDNVTIDDGCVLMMSTIGSGSFLPFRAALYLTAVMENSIVAQNTCLQMCVIGRNSFVGAGSTFTDFNLIEQKPIRAANRAGVLENVGQVVLGGAIGHNCRIGSGMIIFPGRMIESDVVVVASPQRRVISRNLTYEESDHLSMGDASAHKRRYPRRNETMSEEGW